MIKNILSIPHTSSSHYSQHIPKPKHKKISTLANDCVNNFKRLPLIVICFLFVIVVVVVLQQEVI